MTIIELLTLHLQDSLDVSVIDDPSTPAGHIWLNSIARIRRQPGVEFVTYAHRLEDRRYIQMSIGWDALSSHETFKQDPDHAPLIRTLRPLFTDMPWACHVNFAPPEAAKALLLLDGAPVTEIFFAYFTPAEAVADEVTSAYAVGVEEFYAKTGEQQAGQLGHAGGWAVEEELDLPAEVGFGLELENGDGNGGKNNRKARIYVELVGWESVDAHGRFRQSKAYQENIHLVRTAKPAIEVFHIGRE